VERIYSVEDGRRLGPKGMIRDLLDRCGPPAPPDEGGVTVTWLCTAGILVSDGQTRLLIDPFVSRYDLLRVDAAGLSTTSIATYDKGWKGTYHWGVYSSSLPTPYELRYDAAGRGHALLSAPSKRVSDGAVYVDTPPFYWTLDEVTDGESWAWRALTAPAGRIVAARFDTAARVHALVYDADGGSVLAQERLPARYGECLGLSPMLVWRKRCCPSTPSHLNSFGSPAGHTQKLVSFGNWWSSHAKLRQRRLWLSSPIGLRPLAKRARSIARLSL